jgi:hypothetical protein
LTFAKASAAKVHPLLLPVPHGNLWKLRLDLVDLAIDFPTRLNNHDGHFNLASTFKKDIIYIYTYIYII